MNMKNQVTATIDQISVDLKTMQYTLYLSFCGNQQRFNITHEEAKVIITQTTCEVDIHEFDSKSKIYWIPVATK
jgi:hypothetical protein